MQSCAFVFDFYFICVAFMITFFLLLSQTTRLLLHVLIRIIGIDNFNTVFFCFVGIYRNGESSFFLLWTFSREWIQIQSRLLSRTVSFEDEAMLSNDISMVWSRRHNNQAWAVTHHHNSTSYQRYLFVV